MSYFLSPALEQLRDEIDKAFPKRDKQSDGWIGDPSHAARQSDHNPDWGARGRYEGIVRALDTDVDDRDATNDLRKIILEVVIGDPRVWYVISNGKIYSRTYNWRARKYTGSNGHYKHVHVSLRHEYREFDTSTWGIQGEIQKKLKPLPISLKIVHDEFKAAALGKSVEFRWHVRRVQRALNIRYGAGLKLDGLVGEKTLNAWYRHEARTDGEGRPRVPDETSLRTLVNPLFYLQA